jgi:hypothetical protein
MIITCILLWKEKFYTKKINRHQITVCTVLKINSHGICHFYRFWLTNTIVLQQETVLHQRTLPKITTLNNRWQPKKQLRMRRRLHQLTNIAHNYSLNQPTAEQVSQLWPARSQTNSYYKRIPAIQFGITCQKINTSFVNRKSSTVFCTWDRLSQFLTNDSNNGNIQRAVAGID